MRTVSDSAFVIDADTLRNEIREDPYLTEAQTEAIDDLTDDELTKAMVAELDDDFFEALSACASAAKYVVLAERGLPVR